MNAPAQNTIQPAAAQQPPAAPAPKQLSAIGQLVVTRKNKIQAMQQDFQMALPPNMPADKFVRTVLTAIQMNPQLAEATEQSVINSCMKAATDGLILDGREAALTIYNVNKGTKDQPRWEKEAMYMPMVTGIIKRVRNSGEVSRFNAFVVHKNDKFTIKLGLEMSLEHEPNFNEPGEVIGAYAICRFSDGLDDFEYMPKNQIESIRSRSKSPTKGPWATDYEEMCKKTVLRRLAKRLPMSSDLRNVVERVDEHYNNQPDNDTTIDGNTGEIIEANPPKRPYTKRKGAAAEIMQPAAAAHQQQPETQPQTTQPITRPSAGETVIDGDYTEQGQQGPTEDII